MFYASHMPWGGYEDGLGIPIAYGAHTKPNILSYLEAKTKYFVLFGGQERSTNEVKLEDEFWYSSGQNTNNSNFNLFKSFLNFLVIHLQCLKSLSMGH